MKPTVGRIVHYTNLGDKDGRYPPEQQAAIITGVYPRPGQEVDENGIIISYNAKGEQEYISAEYAVDLHVFYRTGDFFMEAVPFSHDYQRGHWSWPPRENT